MSDKLKKFVFENKQEFDSLEPSKDLWKKIDAQMDIKHPNVSSKWLSKLLYLGFSASILIIATYFITKNLNSSSAKELAMNRKDSVNNSEPHLKTNQNVYELNTYNNIATKKVNDLSINKNNDNNFTPVSLRNGDVGVKDSLPKLYETSDDPLSKEMDKTIGNSAKDKKETVLVANETAELYIPTEPEKTDTYSATIYENSLFCSLIHRFKFPGKVNNFTSESRNIENHKAIMRTISCTRLAKRTDLKAVWLKGSTSKGIKIAVKKGFKNMFLLKPDGRKLNPEAISHYYPGVGVIKQYEGKYFKMTFTKKVELILFFKEVEDGDKIVIEDVLESVVKNKP